MAKRMLNYSSKVSAICEQISKQGFDQTNEHRKPQEPEFFPQDKDKRAVKFGFEENDLNLGLNFGQGLAGRSDAVSNAQARVAADTASLNESRSGATGEKFIF